MQIKLDISSLDLEKIKCISRKLSDKSKLIKPELALREKINKPETYKRFQNEPQKRAFRHALLAALKRDWRETFSEEKAEKLEVVFLQMTRQADKIGAVIFADLISRDDFQSLVKAYDSLLSKHGNQSWIHSYANLANHPDYLTHPQFKHAFLHPLLVSIIAYQIGGAIRLVDARAKNAEPISVKAQDNMLHIDNTPFNDEYKVIVTWEKGKASGPKGQNFVIIPGTHHGARNCFVGKDKKAWSTENGSIFIEPAAVDQVFDLQKETLSTSAPQVIEVHDDDKPLTTLFAAGSLVHHRYRTASGYARSCTILAFHRAGDNPGQFMAAEHVKKISSDGDLTSHLFGYQGTDSEASFIQALALESRTIAEKMDEILTGEKGTELILPENRQLTAEEFRRWKETVTSAPTVEDIKREKLHFPIGEELQGEHLLLVIKQAMMFDKHGPLDLILYEDSHEEIRKWARNRIREMNENHLSARLELWLADIDGPQEANILSPEILQVKIAEVVAWIDSIPTERKKSVELNPVEKIAPEDAFRSLRQLMIDLSEAIERCDSLQTFLSTSLFMLWSVDELMLLVGEEHSILKDVGKSLLNHYFSTATMMQKQEQLEQQAEQRMRTSITAMLGRQHGGVFQSPSVNDNDFSIKPVQDSREPNANARPSLSY